MKQRKKNQWVARIDGTIQVKLTRGKVTLVDPADWERIKKYRWCAMYSRGVFCAASGTSGRKEYMHRIIMDATDEQLVDHINHNPLDNRRTNLRFCTYRQSVQNRKKPRRGPYTSIYKGVSWSNRPPKWTAQIKHQGKNYRLGYFTSEANAARAYNAAARKHHGEFAYLNEIVDIGPKLLESS